MNDDPSAPRLPASLADGLRDLGYDIEPAQPGDPPEASIVARRDLGDRAILVAIDAGGRFRIALTWTIGEWAADDALAGVSLRVVNTLTRAATIVGQAQRPDDMLGVVAGLGALAAWAAPAARSEPIAPPFPPTP